MKTLSKTNPKTQSEPRLMPEMAMTARCIHCQKLFAGPQLVIVGKGVDAVNNRLMQFMEKLSHHVMVEHKELSQEIMVAVGTYQGMLMLTQFQTSSKELAEQSDLIRWQIHQKTLNARLSDEQIKAWVEGVSGELKTLAETNVPEFRAKLAGMIQAVRNELEEPNKYSFTPFEMTGKAS
jgi:hypothetical protein